MKEDIAAKSALEVKGHVEPHAGLLKMSPKGQLVYKVMTVNNLLRSIRGGCLHFNRVDSYCDFPGADKHDGEQLPEDRRVNMEARFEKAPDFSAADYYDQSRSRTYAYCTSLEDSEYIWREYANGDGKGKVSIVFDLAKLREKLNQSLKSGTAVRKSDGRPFPQILDLNYGLIDYVEWDGDQANTEYLQNPIKYAYLKDKQQYAEERELRITLSALGVGFFVQDDGTPLKFPPNLQMAFDFRTAIADGTVREIVYAGEHGIEFLESELAKLGIKSGDGNKLVIRAR